MALRSKVINLVRLNLLDDANQTGRVRQIAVMQEEAHIFFMPILIEMVYAVGVEQTGAALDAVNDVALAQQKFCQIGAILASDAGNECDFGLFCHSVLGESYAG